MRLEREKPWDGGVRISALHRPTVFLSQVALALQFDCEKPWFCAAPKTPRNHLEDTSKTPRRHLETASARALVKWPILANMSILLKEFGHVSGPGFGPQGDLTKSFKQSIISEEKKKGRRLN